MSNVVDDRSVNEAAYLVSRGVRPLALLDSVSQDEAVMGRTYDQMIDACESYKAALPFVLPCRGQEHALVGFAAEAWVIELLDWIQGQPGQQYHQIMGLLLGYSPRAIAEHDVMLYRAGIPIPN